MSARFDLALNVHQTVNEFPYASDLEVWKTPEFWERISKAGVGDCEDYAIEKRARLLAAGVPLEDLRLATCFLPNGVSHAVLVIRDGDVDWVADQTQPGLITQEDMHNMGYRGDEIQVPGKFLWQRWEI